MVCKNEYGYVHVYENMDGTATHLVDDSLNDARCRL